VHPALLDHLDVVGYPDDPVRVNSGQVRLDQIFGYEIRLFGFASGGDEDVLDKVLEISMRNQGHKPEICEVSI
jgi:hypothetical protein